MNPLRPSLPVSRLFGMATLFGGAALLMLTGLPLPDTGRAAMSAPDFAETDDRPARPMHRAAHRAAGFGSEHRLARWLKPPAGPPLRHVPLRPGIPLTALDSLFIGGVDYDDPSGGDVPLVWVGDAGEQWLSASFRVADFTTHDGAPFARISPDLVEGLERLRQAAGSLAILSGYRHPAYNATVGGASESQHMAGRAADVWSPDQSPLDLARLALQAMGCEIGLGLGPRSLHVDVRGELATWTYEGAELPNPAFDAWALAQCGRPVPHALAEAAANALLARAEAADSAAAAVQNLVTDHQDDLIAAAAALPGPGAVVLDLRAGAEIRSVEPGSAEADSLGLEALIAWCARRGAGYFAYAILPAEGPPLTGVTSLAAPALPLPPPTRPAASAAPPDPAEAPPQDGWTIVLSSHPDAAAAESSAGRFGNRLASVDHEVFVLDAEDEGRFRVAVGHFPSAEAAQRALDTLAGTLPNDAWILPL